MGREIHDLAGPQPHVFGVGPRQHDQTIRGQSFPHRRRKEPDQLRFLAAHHVAVGLESGHESHRPAGLRKIIENEGPSADLCRQPRVRE
jgi:hypothetical protein